MNTENLKSKLNNKIKDISNEERITMQETTITKTDTNYAALKNNALDIIKNNLKKLWKLSPIFLTEHNNK